MGLHLQDEVQFVASLGSIKANCMKLKKATIHQRYQQVLSVEPVWPLVPQMRSPCACAACLLSTPQALSFGSVIDDLESLACLVKCAKPGHQSNSKREMRRCGGATAEVCFGVMSTLLSEDVGDTSAGPYWSVQDPVQATGGQRAGRLCC